MVRKRTSPWPGEGIAVSSMRKSDGLGSPTGRATRTTRLAWVIYSSECYSVIASRRSRLLRSPDDRHRDDGLDLSGNLGESSIECRRGAGQILERENVTGILQILG